MSTWTHSAFYHFAPIPNPDKLAKELRACLPPVMGAVIVAPEGINGVLAGSTDEMARVEHDFQQRPEWQGFFTGMRIQHTYCETAPFLSLKIRVKEELVQLGALVKQARIAPQAPAPSLSPNEWRAVLNDPNTVVLDNRNHFEFRLGHFRNAVNPQVNNFRDFADYVQEHAEQWREQGKRVAMYCTGGIRCEKSAPWMQSLGLDIVQLDGGILNFLRDEMEHSSHRDSSNNQDWQGDCFVFDNRMAIDANLKETGTQPEQVYSEHETSSAEAWRLARARRLQRDP